MSRWLLTSLALLLAGCGKPEFTEMPLEDGGCSVLLPGKPERTEFPVGDSQAVAYEVKLGSGFYAVGFRDIAADRPFTLEGAVQEIADGHGGTIRDQEAFTLDQGKGIEFEIASATPKGFVSGRVIQVGGRCFQLLAGGSDASLANPDVRRFLNSFALLPGAVFPSARDETAEWRPFTPPEGGCSVLMPGKPLRTVGFNSLVGARGEVYAAPTPLAQYRLSIVTVPAGKALSADSALERFVAENKQVGLLNQSNLALEAGSGKEFEIAGREGRSVRYLSGRVLLIGDRVYQLLVSGEKARLSSPEVRKFLDSFALAAPAKAGQQGGKGPAR